MRENGRDICSISRHHRRRISLAGNLQFPSTQFLHRPVSHVGLVGSREFRGACSSFHIPVSRKASIYTDYRTLELWNVKLVGGEGSFQFPVSIDRGPGEILEVGMGSFQFPSRIRVVQGVFGISYNY